MGYGAGTVRDGDKGRGCGIRGEYCERREET